jgi:hypothetical protein
MNSIPDFLKKHEKIVAITVLGFLYGSLVARYATEYLLDPNAGVTIIVLSVGWLLVVALFNRFRPDKAKSIPKNSVSFSSLSLSQKVYGVLFSIFFLVLMPYGFWVKTFENISRLKTESPFFAPNQNDLITEFNKNKKGFNEIVTLVAKENIPFFYINIKNQKFNEETYPKITKKMKDLDIILMQKSPNQISLSIFKGKKKDILFLSASKLANTTPENSCKKVETNFYLCFFDTP